MSRPVAGKQTLEASQPRAEQAALKLWFDGDAAKARKSFSLCEDGRIYGLLQLSDKSGGRDFDADDEEHIRELAALVGEALDAGPLPRRSRSERGPLDPRRLAEVEGEVRSSPWTSTPRAAAR